MKEQRIAVSAFEKRFEGCVAHDSVRLREARQAADRHCAAPTKNGAPQFVIPCPREPHLSNGNNSRAPDAINQVLSFAGLDVNRQLFALLMECTYLEMQIKVMASEALVLVHGYADGELANWSKPLNGAVYNIA